MSDYPIPTVQQMAEEAETMIRDLMTRALEAANDKERYEFCSLLSSANSMYNGLLSLQRVYEGKEYKDAYDYARLLYGRTLESIIQREGDERPVA
jgi:hypothetical protein